MFSVIVPEGEPWYSAKRYLMDSDRDVSVQFTRTAGSDPVLQFFLVHRTVKIPFATFMSSGATSPANGEKYFWYTFEGFGPPTDDNGKSLEVLKGVTSDFSIDDLKLLAVEAVLIYGSDYNGLKLKPGYTRFEFNGEMLTRNNFGYDD